MYDSLIELSIRNADIIDEVDENNTYLGFFEYGATEIDRENCVIQKISKEGTITTMKWANGNQTIKNLIWNERGTYQYNFKK